MGRKHGEAEWDGTTGSAWSAGGKLSARGRPQRVYKNAEITVPILCISARAPEGVSDVWGTKVIRRGGAIGG